MTTANEDASKQPETAGADASAGTRPVEPAHTRLTQSVEWVKVQAYAGQEHGTTEGDGASSVSASADGSGSMVSTAGSYLSYVQDQLQGFCDTVSKTSTETRVIAGTGLLLGVVAGAVVYSQSTTIGSLQLKNASLKSEVSSIQSQVRWKR